MARTLATERADEKFVIFQDRLKEAVGLQVHIVSTLHKRVSVLERGVLSGGGSEFNQSFHTSLVRTCTCPPLRRCVGKQPACRGVCLQKIPVFRLAPIEERYVQACGNGVATLNMLQDLKSQYSAFDLRTRGVQFIPSFSQVTVETSGVQSKLTPAEAGAFVQYFQSAALSFEITRTGMKVPWLLVLLDFCAMFPQHTSWLVQNSLHQSVSKFRVVATLFLNTQECQICVAKQSTMCSDFGFGRMSGFFGHISFYHPHKVWYLLAALSIRNLDLAVGSRMMSYSFRDDLNVLQTLPDNLH